MSGEIRHLFVTLKRSFAGTRETHINIVRSLGLRKREQTVKKANTSSVRGAIDKVKHLVTIETDYARAARLRTEAAKAAPRPPVIIQHRL